MGQGKQEPAGARTGLIRIRANQTLDYAAVESKESGNSTLAERTSYSGKGVWQE